MREAFLHYIWKYQRFKKYSFCTTDGVSVRILHPGLENSDAGPDFFNARIQIGDKLWAGNVELHINSSDWFAHSHQNDQAYDNVILHVVWNHNAEIYRMDGSKVDTLNLFEYVDRSLVQNYHGLINSKSWINCEKDFPEIDDFSLRNWLERLYIERLEHKSNRIFRLLEQFHNDWEQVLFILLMRNFGSKVNADAFESCALSIDYKTLCKISQDQNDLEALFFGQMGLLEESASDVYEMELLKRYGYLKHKYKLSVRGIVPLKFFRMRPANFPTIRLSQLAALYHKSDGIFSKIKTSNTVNELYTIFNVAASSYWDTHYNFGQKSVKKIKNLTPSFIQLLIINTVIPLRYAYQRFKGNLDAISLLSFAEQVPMEKNRTVNRFMELKTIPGNAMISQALLELKTNYCNKNRCLSCSVAAQLLL